MSKFDEAIPEGTVPERPRKKVHEVLKFQPSGSVEDAKKAMLAAGQQPGGPNAKLRSVDNTGAVEAEEIAAPPAPAIEHVMSTPGLTGDFDDELEVTPPPVKPAAAPAPAPVQPPPRVERVDNAHFTAEIKQEDGQWVGEIKYKNGAGTEKFTAPTKNQLMVKLLEGKGHATLRVNKAVRREKLGFSELDRQYPLPNDMTVEDFNQMTDKAQDAVLWSVANNQGLLFREQHPEYYPIEENKAKLLAFLNKEKLPITARNLGYALEELSDPNLPADVRLEERPGVSAPPPTPSLVQPAPTTPPARTDSAPAAPAPAPVPTAAPAEAPGVTVRKRGTTGLRPSDSSVETAPGAPEGGSESREPSEAELRKMPLSQLRRIARSEWKQHNRV